MEAKKTYKTFRYRTDLVWKSGRNAVISAAGKPSLEVSSPTEFKGDPGFWTPEDMFVASINMCTLMTFVAFAQHKGLEFLSYDCAAEGLLENVEGKYRFTEVVLRPRVALMSQADIERAQEILASAHRNCLITNSITTAVKIQPDFQILAAAA